MKFFLSICLVFATLGASCETKRDIKRQQEYEKIKQEVREARGTRADLDVMADEFRTELTRMSTNVDELGQAHRVQNEELKKEIAALTTKVQALEAAQAAANATPPPKPPKAASYETAKGFFDEQKYDEAVEEARAVVKSKPKAAPESRKAQYLVAEALFASRDYGAAALEFSEFKKAYPKDANVPVATLRQAQCFRNLGKEKEAKLFYQETVDRFPKSPAAAQAKRELRKTGK